MSKEIELPNGLSVMVDVDLHYSQGRLEPFQFIYQGEHYRISRINRRRKGRLAARELCHYQIRIEQQRGVFELLQDVPTAIWSLRRVEPGRKRATPNPSPTRQFLRG